MICKVHIDCGKAYTVSGNITVTAVIEILAVNERYCKEEPTSSKLVRLPLNNNINVAT